MVDGHITAIAEVILGGIEVDNIEIVKGWNRIENDGIARSPESGKTYAVHLQEGYRPLTEIDKYKAIKLIEKRLPEIERRARTTREGDKEAPA